jgi:hypothetical protein
MTTIQLSPEFCRVEDWRQVQKVNRSVKKIPFTFVTDATWLPQFLTEAGFFVSNGEVKRNKPEFWRDIVPGEIITISWAIIRIETLDNGASV